MDVTSLLAVALPWLYTASPAKQHAENPEKLGPKARSVTRQRSLVHGTVFNRKSCARILLRKSLS